MKNVVAMTLEELNASRCLHESPRDENWTKHTRHFFIITDSARPVYCRYGEEVNVTPLLCTIVAFTGQLIRDGDQKLKTVVAGNKRFVFFLPLPFIFVAVSSANIPDAILQKELEILQSVMFSVLSSRISEQVRRRPNFDIKKQSFTMERMFTSALNVMDHAPWFIFKGFIPMAAATKERGRFAAIVNQYRDKSILAVVMFHQGSVFLILEHTGFRLSADDILILTCNTYPDVHETDSFKSWVPIWLPSNEAMVHMFTADLPSADMKMILLSTEIMYTVSFGKMVIQIMDGMKSSDLSSCVNPMKIFPDKAVIHWMAADHDLNQIYCPGVEISSMSELVYRNYAWTYEFMLKNDDVVKGLFYAAMEGMTVFGVRTEHMTIIAAANAGVRADTAEHLTNSLTAFVSENRDYLFNQKPIRWE